MEALRSFLSSEMHAMPEDRECGMIGMDEVAGSNPAISSIEKP